MARWLRPRDRVKDVGNITDGQDGLHTLQGPVQVSFSKSIEN